MRWPRTSLTIKILLVAFLNVLLLVFVFSAFARFQFRLDPSSYLIAPAADKMMSVSRLIAFQLVSKPSETWGRVLDDASATYPAQLYLLDESGVQLAGRAVALPVKFREALRHREYRRGDYRFGGYGSRGLRPDSQRMGDQKSSDQRPGDQKLGDQRPPFGFGEHGVRPPPEHGGGFGPPFSLTRTTNPTEYWADVHIPIAISPGGERPRFGILVWRFQSFWTQPFFFDYRPWLGAILAVVFVSIVCWLPLIRGLTRAISQLTTATGQIAEGQFEIEVATKRRDELGLLSESISRMAHRLSGLVYGQRRFLSDIAHELSSPIARAQLAIAIVEQRSNEKQQQYLTDLREEMEQMSELVSELLTFSKSKSMDPSVELKPVNVADVVGRVLEREHSHEAEIKVEIDDSTEVLAQPEYLFRSLANLVRNAIRYAATSGPIVVSTAKSGNDVTITVSDSGPGLPDDELENVFRPFYRPEFARQRETGGAGLGLAIVRSCIEACGGAVKCRNRIPKGLEVEIRLASTR